MGMMIASTERMRSLAAAYERSDNLWMDDKLSIRFNTAMAGFTALSDSWNLLKSSMTMKSSDHKMQELTRAGKLVILAVSAFALGMFSPDVVFTIQRHLELQASHPNVLRRLLGRVSRILSCPVVKTVAGIALLFATVSIIHRLCNLSAKDMVNIAQYKKQTYEEYKYLIDPLRDPILNGWNWFTEDSKDAMIYAGKVVAEVAVILPGTVIGVLVVRKVALAGRDAIQKLWRSL